MAASPEPFVIAVPETLLNDLRQRLALTRWPDEITGSGWHYGAGGTASQRTRCPVSG